MLFRSVIDDLARAGIREAMAGLKGKPATTQCQRLATEYGITTNTIYTITRADRPERKRRKDKGQRQHDILENEGLRYAAELVANKHLKPAAALEAARKDGHDITISEGTFQAGQVRSSPWTRDNLPDAQFVL